MTSPRPLSGVPLGLGISGALAQKWFSPGKVERLVHHAIGLGVRDFDTGSFYGAGRAEARLGAALKSAFDSAMIDRASLCISSKTGTQIAPDGSLLKDFSRDAILRDVETSLSRLSVDALDILYLHGPNEHELLSSLPTLIGLKHDGLIHATGVCTEGAIATQAAHLGEIDVLMCAYNIFDRQHVSALQVAKESGKKTVAISPLAQGLYRQGMMVPKSPSDLWYIARALGRNREGLATARTNRDALALEGWSPSDVALAFCLANEDVDIAMTTTTRARNLASNVAATAKSLPAEKLAALTTLVLETAPGTT